MSSDQGKYEFILSKEELLLLRKLSSNNQPLTTLLSSAQAGRGGKFGVRMNRTEAERVRDLLTEELARRGFKEDYSPTKEGQVLEELIDRFYLA
jgi:hypothetical protein